MNNFSPFSSKIFRIPQKDIDTDLIIPAPFLKVTDQKGLGEGCFFELRKDPHFSLNQKALQGSRVLIAGPNFGCGSSREHAAWALRQVGIDTIISSQFADIFRGNAEKNGILLITLQEKVIQHLLQFPNVLMPITIDLPKEIIIFGEESFSFSLPSFSKKRLLEGTSDIDFLKELLPKIQIFHKKRLPFLPSLSS